MQSVSKRNDSALAGLAAVGMSIFAGLLRLLPHWPNFTPVGALGLFAGARLRFWQACTVPLVVMAVSDLLLWGAFGKKPFDPFVYASLLISVALGRLFLKTGGLWRVPVVSAIASLQFFAVTNFGVWAGGDGSLYPKTLAGLGTCYFAGLPFTGDWRVDGTQFFFGTVAGDLAYTTLFFGLYAVILFVAERRKAGQPA